MLRTIEARAQAAVLTLWIVVAVAVADVYAHANRLRLVQDAVDEQVPGVPLRLPTDVVNRADAWVTIGLIASTLAFLLAAAAWLAFQYPVHRRLAADMTAWRASPRAGVAVWLVPVVNLLAPAVLLAALLRAAARPAPLLVALWWICWVGTTVLAGFATRNPEVLADQRLPDALAMGGDILAAGAAVLAIGFVRRLADYAASA
ncbi:DUF4328 domain-containing protein [Paraconexibacter sp.]|uniref:DUF4328 domain-containing protein n=1 Tax=Paraconexibacter sp. TaxID=2949640 RepID=UPI003565CCF7